MARRPFDGPVRITQEYGERNSFYRKGYHTGVDYGLSIGHPLVSPTRGTVQETGYEASRTNGRGYFVIIKGDDGVTHHIYHMNRQSLVKAGVRVSEGTPIGAVGNTGASEGAHLHWETRRAPHDGSADFAPGTWLFAPSKPYVPAPPVTKEYIRIFGDYRTLYRSAGRGWKGVLAPNAFGGGKLDYEVLGRSGDFVKIRTGMLGEGWIFAGNSVANLTQFYRR